MVIYDFNFVYSPTSSGNSTAFAQNLIALQPESLAQVIIFGPAPALTVGGTGTVTASSAPPNSGQPITFSTTSTTCSVTAAGVVTGIQAGTDNCIISATQLGDAVYLHASATLLLSIGQAAQSLTFPGQTSPTQPLTIGAEFAIDPPATSNSPNSGNPIIYSSLTPAVCTVSGTQVKVVAAGTCTLAADQAGNTNFTAATQVTQSITALPTVTLTKVLSPVDDPGKFTLSINDTTAAGQGHDGKVGPVSIAANTAVTVTETPDAGTNADDYTSVLTCKDATGAELPTTDTGFTMPAGNVSCTFTNTRKAAPAAATPVPTLGEWSLMLLGLLAAGMGMRRLRR